MDTNDPKQESAPPLPTDPDLFYRAGGDLDLLQAWEPAGSEPALELLGPAPFRRPGFPFLGFLATVYDHVSEQVGGSEEKTDTGM